MTVHLLASLLLASSPASPEPPAQAREFVIGNHDGKRALIVRDGQHEYFFTETSS